MTKVYSMSGLRKEIPSHRNGLGIAEAPSLLNNYTFTNFGIIQYSVAGCPFKNTE